MISNSIFLSDAGIQALGWTLVHSLWQGTAIALILWMVLPRLKDARQRYWASYAALMSIMVAAIGSFVWVYSTQEPTVALSSAWTFSIENTLPEMAVPAAESSSGFWQTLADTLTPYHPVIVTIWMLGFLFFLVQFIGGLHYVHRLRMRHNQPVVPEWQAKLQALAAKIGHSKPVGLLESSMVKAPMALGFFKPIILLPIGMINQLSVVEVEAILAHELAHIARRDWLFNLVQALVETIFYFHPAVWWVATTIRAERENCCDDVAVRLTGDRLVYAKTLVHLQDIARSGTSPALALSLEGSPNLLRRRPLLLDRVKRILHQPQQSSSLMEKTIALGILAALITLWTVRANTPPALAESIREIAEKPLTWFEADADPVPEYAYQVVGDTVPNPKKTRQRIVREDDNQRVEMELEDGAIKELKIDGKEIKKENYDQYKELVDRIRGEAAPAPAPSSVEDVFEIRTFPEPTISTRLRGLPSSPSRISTETDDKGNTIILLERGGEPVKIRVENGDVWLGDKKVEKGKSIEIPGSGKDYFFWNDGNNTFELKGQNFQFKGDDHSIFEVPAPAASPHIYQFDSDGNKFFFKGHDNMIIEMPELPDIKVQDVDVKKAYEEALRELRKEKIYIERELRDKGKAQKKNRKQWEKERREQLKAIEKAQRALADSRLAQKEALARVYQDQARVRADVIKIEKENLARARQQQARVRADVRRAQRDAELLAKTQRVKSLANLKRAEQEYRIAVRERNRGSSVSGAIKSELLEDKLIKDPDNYSFELSNKSMRVNGKKQSSDTHKKYLELYRRKAGKDIGKGKVRVEVEN